MRKIKLTDRIYYCHFEEASEDGDNHGILLLEPKYNFPLKTHTVADQEDFKFWYSRFAKAEEEQTSTAALSRTKYTL